MRTPTLLLSALMLCSPGRAETKGALRVSLGGGFDTNARRDFLPAQDSTGARPDMVASATGAAEGLWRTDRTLLGGTYELGGRKFLLYPSEDVLAQSAQLEGTWAVARRFGLGVNGRGKDRRGGERDYTDLSARLFAEFSPDAKVSLRAEAGAHRFLYWNRFGYSFGASELALTGRYRFNRHHSVATWGELGFRRYHATATPNPTLAPPPSSAPRADNLLTAGVGYTYRGPFTLSVHYAYSEQVSNSFGETTLRHRVTAHGGLRLPWQLTLMAQLAAQLTHYPDGVYLSPELSIVEDDESHNSVSLKLSRAMSERLDVEVRYSLFQNQLPNNGLSYLRQLGWAGATARF